MAGLVVGLALVQALAVARVPLTTPSDLTRLAALGFEVAGLEVDAAGVERAVVVVSPETRGLLTAAGFAAEALEAPVTRGASAFRNYYDFDDPLTGVRRQLAALAAARPHLTLDSIGASVEGRPILAVKIGPPDDSPGRPNVLFMATHHAREWVSTTMAMYLVHYLADTLAPAQRDARDIWVIPVVNPDGYQYSFDGDRLWRKNRRLNADGTFGVDLNRNYPAFWGRDDVGSSPVPGTEIYRGTAPASEPEVQAIVRFHERYRPAVSVSYHTYTGLVLHPPGFEEGRVTADDDVFRALAGTPLAPAVIDRVPGSVRTAYHPGPLWQLFRVNGEYTDWAYRRHGAIGFTPELTSGCCINGNWYGFVFPDDATLLARVHADNLPFALAAVAAVGDPARAVGASGLTPGPSRLVALWPEIRLLERSSGSPAARRVAVRTGAGATPALDLIADSLDQGRFYRLYRGVVDSLPPVGVAALGLPVRAGVLAHAGAEPGEAPWVGWTTTANALVGRGAWRGLNDTLVSPELDVGGHGSVWLQLWTKHAGSAFLPDRRGVVQYSDGGRPWLDLAVVSAAAPAWYPLRIDLPPLASGRVRFRFVSERMEWWLDAVGLMTDATSFFEEPIPVTSDELAVSDNPVRGTRVTFSWPASADPTVLEVYSFAGDLVYRARVPPGIGVFAWDLETRAGAGVRDGGYVVVVRSTGQVLRRRLFVARGGR